MTGNGETLTATTCNAGTSLDTIVQVACDCGLSCVAGNDDSGCASTGASEVSWCSQPGKIYKLSVGDYSADAGTFELSVSSDGVPCEMSDSCPNPGACCLSSGECQFVLESDCTGFYRGDYTCEPNLCPPVGACCSYESIVCTLAPEDHCLGFLDRFHSGLTCDQAHCFDFGACCLPSGQCFVTYEEVCILNGGVFAGSSTSCDPNLCPQPIGSCCLDDNCQSEVTEADCAGSWTEGGSCIPDPCTAPANDSCETATALSICDSALVSNVSAADDVTPECEVDGSTIDTPTHGVWYSVVGNGQTLTATTCNGGTLVDTRIQVFCECDSSLPCMTGNDDSNELGCDLPDGSFYKSTVSWCAESGRTYYLIVGAYSDGEYGAIELSVSADGNTCAAPACAVPSNDTCDVAQPLAVGDTVTASTLHAVDDSDGFCGTHPSLQDLWYEVTGNGETLTASTCNPGTDIDTILQVACDCGLDCVAGDDDSCPASRASVVSWCSQAGKNYKVSVGGYDGAGPIELSVTSDGTPCNTSDNCPVPGACCMPSGECQVVLEADCTGAYQGNSTSCDPNKCPQPIGACCTGGLCFGTTRAECDGDYKGDGTVCSVEICAQSGACCLHDGTCTITSPFTCTVGLRGNFRGVDTTCEDPCPVRQLVSSSPAHCTIDARVPFPPNQPTQRQGFQSIQLQFDGLAGSTEDGPEDFTVSHVPATVLPAPPTIESVDIVADTATIQFDVPIHPGYWTCVRHNISGQQRCIGFLPADVNSSRAAVPSDILDLVDNLNGVHVPPLQLHQCDIDRSNLCAPADIMGEVDLLNGVNAYPNANGTQLELCPPTAP